MHMLLSLNVLVQEHFCRIELEMYCPEEQDGTLRAFVSGREASDKDLLGKAGLCIFPHLFLAPGSELCGVAII